MYNYEIVIPTLRNNNMPCKDSDDDCYNSGVTIDEVKALINESKRATPKENEVINDLTAMLCIVCNYLESISYNFALNPLLDRWWYAHKQADLKQKEVEFQKESNRILANARQAVIDKQIEAATFDICKRNGMDTATLELLKKHNII